MRLHLAQRRHHDGAGLADAGITADETIDASGKYVIPGAIDVHTHMELPFGGTFAKDTFETGTRAAAFGGTTAIVDFAVQPRGGSLRQGLDAWQEKAAGNACVDYGFHMIMSDVRDDVLSEMDTLVDEGVTTFKLFTAYPGVFFSDDGSTAVEAARRAGIRHAAAATSVNTPMTPAYVIGSVGSIPINKLSNPMPTPIDSSSPTINPAPISRAPLAATSRKTSARVAPTATRIPISLARAATLCAVTP